MERRQTWALWLGVSLLAAAQLLTPLLAFRLCAATAGPELATLLAVLLPASAALGAVGLGPRFGMAEPARVAQGAALASLVSAASWLGGLLVLTWLAQRLGTPPEQAAVALRVSLILAWMLAGGSAGTALALGMRLGVAAMGRVGFAEAAGAAAACLAVPLVLLLGVPRAALLATLLPGLGAFAFVELRRGHAPGPTGTRGQPSRAVLVTLPLVVAALLAGDVGDPWLHIPNDGGKRSTAALHLWAPGGLVTVNKPTSRAFGYTVDGGELIPLGSLRASATKPAAGVLDLAFALESKGSALVIGSGGGREVLAALGQGADVVHALELEPAVLKGVVLGRFAEETGRCLAPSERLQPSLGDGRAGLRRLRALAAGTSAAHRRRAAVAHSRGAAGLPRAPGPGRAAGDSLRYRRARLPVGRGAVRARERAATRGTAPVRMQQQRGRCCAAGSADHALWRGPTATHQVLPQAQARGARAPTIGACSGG
jgi:hypothetical protein